MGELYSEHFTKKTSSQRSVKWITHYNSTQRILLVGEGDFSFSACLANAFGSAKNMVATSLDSKATLYWKQWSSEAHLQDLKELRCVILYKIDVKNMHEHKVLKNMKFDRIIFNFPHAGHDPLLKESDKKLIMKHRKLLENFFMSSSKMLSEEGEVHVTHRNDYPYRKWKLEKLAKKAGFVLVEMVEFMKEKYPGYHNKRGGSIKSNKKFPLKECFTFKFSLEKSLEEDDGLIMKMSSLLL
ncbi:uncharacterized protein At4g26485 isoform X1 [Dioscorea cayenensis subsp. rotundata]|uniref:Uncharacterized protein At4g26485 isoform X1 n=1 Tax=Dioscorea cayennensis subsp. rotundata TaxID=55577 RepID=A0AB40ATL2_DIOCR|nr:uncharacterized protein At4g26485 isoform X1 [Dioscorea cayenensis subsp. rotundata]